MSARKPVLEIEGLHVSRGGRPVLRDVGATVRAGELYGIIGANGSGKSTLVQSIVRLLPRTSGRILYRGTSIDTLERRALAREIAYLQQNPECHWPLTAERLVTLGRIPHLGPWGAPGPEDRRAVSDALAAVDVGHLAERSVNRLSGGEQRRVLLARALAGEPHLLLADEPSSGLDPFHQLQLMELLLERVVNGVSVVLVLHNLALASRFCDRILLLRDGEVLAEGNPAAVLTDANLAAAYGVEARHLSADGQTAVVPWRRI